MFCLKNIQSIEAHRKDLFNPLFKNKEYVLFTLFEAVAEKIKAVSYSLSYLGIDSFEAGAEWNLSPMEYYLGFIKLLKQK